MSGYLRDLAERLRSEWESITDGTACRGPTSRMLCELGRASAASGWKPRGLGTRPSALPPYGTTGVLPDHPADRGLYQPVQILHLPPTACRPRTPGGRAAADHIAELGVSNPTTPSAAAMVKGSGRGHDFLRLLTDKLGGTVGAARRRASNSH